MAYNGTVGLMAGIIQRGGGDFPLVDAPAVRVDDDTRLDSKLSSIDSDIAEIRADVISDSTIDNLVTSIFTS